MAKLTPLSAIRLKCLDCSGQQYKEIRLCSDLDCSVYLYRFGKRPKENERIAFDQALAAKAVNIATH